MTSRRTRAFPLMLLLLGAVLVTAAIVALFRYGSVGGWEVSPVEPDHVTPLLGTFTIFAAGGVPVALMCWSLERPVSGGSSRVSRNSIRHVLIPNALAAVVVSSRFICSCGIGIRPSRSSADSPFSEASCASSPCLSETRCGRGRPTPTMRSSTGDRLPGTTLAGVPGKIAPL